MPLAHSFSPLIAADLGNTQAKLGVYAPATLANFSRFYENTDLPRNAGLSETFSSSSVGHSGKSTVELLGRIHPEFLRTVRNDRDLETELRVKIPEFFAACDSVHPSGSQLGTVERDVDQLVARKANTISTDEPWNWAIASVNRPSTTRLVEWIRCHRPSDSIFLLAATDLPIPVGLPSPDRVGIDRLLDAVAANALRHPDHVAVVVDAGSAITVDLVSSEGVFCGGAILPGMQMSARAMYQFTDMLPLLETSEMLEHIPAVGRTTEHAMRSGLFWGTVGAIREMVYRMSEESAQLEGVSELGVDLFLTGGMGSVAGAFLCEPGPLERATNPVERGDNTTTDSRGTRVTSHSESQCQLSHRGYNVYYDAELTLLGILLTALPILLKIEEYREPR